MGEYGTHFMISPMTNEHVINQKTCFALNGTAGDVIGPQAMLPDVSNFKVIYVVYIFFRQYTYKPWPKFYVAIDLVDSW